MPLGKIQEFDEKTDNIDVWFERLDQYILANSIDSEIQAAVLLTTVGPDAFQVIRDLISPAKPKDKTYDELISLLRKHYNPPSSEIAERFRFYKRQQQGNETVTDFIVAIKQLASKCNFQDFLDQALRDRLVCGLRSQQAQRKLLTEKALTFNQAAEIARSMELAERTSKEFVTGDVDQSFPVDTDVNTVNRIFNSKGQQVKTFSKNSLNPRDKQMVQKNKCSRCMGQHEAGTCRFRDAVCHYCHKKGHLKVACRQLARKTATDLHQVDSELPTSSYKHSQHLDDDDDLFGIFRINDNAAEITKEPRFMAAISLNGKKITMDIDTGSGVSLIPVHVYREHFSALPLLKTPLKLNGYSGTAVKVLGKIVVDVQHETFSGRLPLAVVDVPTTQPSLLGRNWLSKMKLNWNNVFSVSDMGEKDSPKICADTSSEFISQLIRDFPAPFTDDMTPVEDFQAQIHVDPAAPPIYYRSRSVPYNLLPKVEKKIEELESQGILRKVVQSDWATPLVVVPKDGGRDIRICGDYKLTVNRVSKPEPYPLPNIEDLLVNVSGGKVFSHIDLRQAYQQCKLHEVLRRD